MQIHCSKKPCRIPKPACNCRAAGKLLLRVSVFMLAVLIIAGCAATTDSMLQKAERIEACLNGECGPASSRFTKDELIGGLLVMLKANENSEAVLCESDSSLKVCKNEALKWYVQGGPIPGVASIKKPYFIQVGLDKQTSQIKFKIDATIRWIGTPVFCQDGYTELSVFSTDHIEIESKFTCTWTAFPHIWNIQYSVGFIDFDNSIIAGNYAVSGGGLLTAGGGTGTFIMRLAHKDTLTAQAAGNGADIAEIVPVGQLPLQIMATPVPLREEAIKNTKAADQTERTLWESVAKKKSAIGYRQYLARYPEGRFAGTAAAELHAIEQRESQNRELALWSKIKDSSDPNDFESYIAMYPEGLFVDLASARTQRLMAVAAEAADLDVELALWDQVKGSTDANAIKTYLKRYPDGQFAGTARKRIEKLTTADQTHDLEMEMWNKVKHSRNTGDFQNFLQAFPNGIFAGIAKSRIENLISLEAQTKELALWDGIKASRDQKDFEEYLRLYPQGQYADHVRRLSRHLAALETEHKEMDFWESVKESKNPADFDAYLAKYPEGRFGQAARKRRQAARLAQSIAAIDFGRYHALVIGNNDYRNLSKLGTAVNDAKAVGSLLEQAYGFEVTYLINAGRKQIIDALSRMRRGLTIKDNLIIYYAGHGWLDKEAGRGYWLPIDSERNSPANWISTGDISDTLKAMAAKHVMVVADSCYSGTLTRSVKLNVSTSEYFRRIVNIRTRVVLTSGGLEPVLDDGMQGHSVFTKAFLDVLEKNNGILEGTRLFNELRRPVILNAPQTPEYSNMFYAGHEGGDFLFVRQKASD